MTLAINLANLANYTTPAGQVDASGVTGVLTSPKGGTGLSNPGTLGNVLTSDGSTWVSRAPAVGVPSGVILLWHGSEASIPDGWYLCNGGNGTPDLRGCFIIGASTTYPVNAQGGSADAIVVSHSHAATTSITDPGHYHFISNSNYAGMRDGAALYGSESNHDLLTVPNTATSTTGITAGTTVNATGSSGTNANLPPFYALCYIMKA